MLNQSGLLQQLQQFSVSPDGWLLCIYGDPAYPLRVHLKGPFKRAIVTPLEAEFNKSMSAMTIAVEWIFEDIVNYFAFLDLKKNLKIGLSAIGKMYIVCALLRNCTTYCTIQSACNITFNVFPSRL